MTLRPLDWIILIGGSCLAPLMAAFFLTVPMSGRAEAGETCRGQLVRASWYGAESGSRTASGLFFNGTQLLVAHKNLPFHTKLRLSYRGRSIVVPVEDRGPFVAGRTLDLSTAVARRLGTIEAGVALVCMERLG